MALQGAGMRRSFSAPRVELKIRVTMKKSFTIPVEIGGSYRYPFPGGIPVMAGPACPENTIYITPAHLPSNWAEMTAEEQRTWRGKRSAVIQNVKP